MDKKTADDLGLKIIEEGFRSIGGFGGAEILCDLREIPELTFCGYSIKNVRIATQQNESIGMHEVIGMNILKNFLIGLDLDHDRVLLNKRKVVISAKPEYSCGEISLLVDMPYRQIREDHQLKPVEVFNI